MDTIQNYNFQQSLYFCFACRIIRKIDTFIRFTRPKGLSVSHSLSQKTEKLLPFALQYLKTY